MKKIIIFLAAAVLLAGCTPSELPEIKTPTPVPVMTPVPEATAEQTTEIDATEYEDVAIGGVIESIDSDTVTLTGVEGMEGVSSIAFNVNEFTLWEIPRTKMAEGLYVTALVSSGLSDSVPPLTLASRIFNFDEVVTGQVTEITENSIKMTPDNGYNSNGEITLVLLDTTVWDAGSENIQVGDRIRALASVYVNSESPYEVDCDRVMGKISE
ncbi:MAG: hypothetical protein JXN65_03220 [Clostridia bacterium]|nr:hypothetical protein [Clostridia bacterium]